MEEHGRLADRFQAQRGQLLAVAYRILGSASEAEDAVQEAWLRLERADVGGVQNLAGWLTTVVSRVCLDMLRTRAARREELSGQQVPDQNPDPGQRGDPENAAVQAESVGLALLVVLDRLVPVERVAFVLHDMFAVPFDEIAPIVGRSPVTTKKLASRARVKVRGTSTASLDELAQQRRVVEAFLAASRTGDIEAVLAVLAPDVVRRADRSAVGAGRAIRLQGARAVAEEITLFGRHARSAEPALVDGAIGVVVAPAGRLLLAIAITVEGEKISAYDVIAGPARLRRINLGTADR